MHVCTYVYVYICMHISSYVCMVVLFRLYIYMYRCIYIYTYAMLIGWKIQVEPGQARGGSLKFETLIAYRAEQRLCL